ncbi:MAG: NAD(P)/FAD-dependent oxidoreductase [Thalassospira sp.]|uniref:NAD(P)/FAD-dependent oxidoreductase n=1 Tax=Thalassospira sp. TaxID=1912094 RepID=UPI0032EC711D
MIPKTISNETSPRPIFDVVIIGGSFAGLTAAMQLARARRNICVIDAGKPRNRFALTSHGFLGLDGKSPTEIRKTAISQLMAYPTVTMRDGLVSHGVPHAGPHDSDMRFDITIEGSECITARRIILATGVRDILPDISGMTERWGVTVLHCPYCHGYEVRDEQIGVIATMPQSSHQAMMLPDWGPTTYFTQGVYLPDDETSAKMAQRGITIENSPVVALLGTAPVLEAVRLADGRTLPITAVFTGPKVAMPSPVAELLGCAFDDGPQGPFIKVDASQETTVPGIFAAGDAAAARHNATLASAAGIMAGFGAHQSLIFA